MAPSGKRNGLGRLIDRETIKVVLAIVAIAIVVGAATWYACGDFGIVFGMLGALAIVLAAIQFADARHTLGNIEEVSGKLEGSTNDLQNLREDLTTSTKRLEGQLSTRWIGVFPDYLPQIVDLVGSATESVVIFCDFPAYGEFTKWDTYGKYAEVIREKGPLVSLLCLDEDKRRALAEQQVSTGGGWESWRSAHEVQIGEYLADQEHDDDPKTISRQRLVSLLCAGDARALRDEFGAAEKWTTSLVMPLYFWIVDNEKAVFGLAPFVQEKALEVGFRTVDGNLIGALNGIFSRYKEESQKAGQGSSAAAQAS
jgi:hypothetical protein